MARQSRAIELERLIAAAAAAAPWIGKQNLYFVYRPKVGRRPDPARRVVGIALSSSLPPRGRRRLKQNRRFC